MGRKDIRPHVVKKHKKTIPVQGLIENQKELQNFTKS
jgi:hypothetical protein